VTATPLSSEQPSATLTSIPTPSLAVIAASTDGGANVRTEPGGGIVIITLINGTQVEVLPERQTVGTSQWVRIRTLEGLEGWVLQSVLAVPTP
jgi:SH3-like domain-containing protein